MKEASYTVMYYGLKPETNKPEWWNLDEKGGFTILPEIMDKQLDFKEASALAKSRNNIATQKCRHVVCATYDLHNYWFVNCPNSKKVFEKDSLPPVNQEAAKWLEAAKSCQEK